jgi:hypothetical protein
MIILSSFMHKYAFTSLCIVRTRFLIKRRLERRSYNHIPACEHNMKALDLVILITITILDIMNLPDLFKTLHIGDWRLSPSAGESYRTSFGDKRLSILSGPAE